jgi:hypothetical protein
MLPDQASMLALSIGISVALLDRLKHHFLVFAICALPGTLLHEMSHFLVAALTGGRPSSFSVIPRRVGAAYVLGPGRSEQSSRVQRVVDRPRAPFTVAACLLALSLVGVPLCRSAGLAGWPVRLRDRIDQLWFAALALRSALGLAPWSSIVGTAGDRGAWPPVALGQHVAEMKSFRGWGFPL